jgi:hypothetical protein
MLLTRYLIMFLRIMFIIAFFSLGLTACQGNNNYKIVTMKANPDKLLFFDKGKNLYGIDPSNDRIACRIEFKNLINYAGTYSNNILYIDHNNEYGFPGGMLCQMDSKGHFKNSVKTLPNAAHFWVA